MKKLLPILLILFALIGNSQDFVYPANYTLGNYCFQGNGTSNYINTGQKIVGRTAMSFDFYYKGDLSVRDYLFSCGTRFSDRKGIAAYIPVTGTISFRICNGAAIISFHSSTILVSANVNTHIIISWSGFVADNIFITINGVTEDINVTTDWIGDSNRNSTIGYSDVTGPYYIKGSIWNFKYTINGNSVVHYPLSEGYNNQAYDVGTAGNHRTITGADYWITCTNNTYNEDYGMTYVKYGSQKVLVPYLLNGNSQYSAVSPVINASEVTREFPASWWDSQKAVSNLGKIAVQ